MAMDEKWAKPGWRIEQKYGDKVLIGNWAEERLQFTRDCRTSTSTHCADYLPQRDHRPDVFVRREALRRAEGLPTRLLLDHHNLPRSHYLVSHYDETYGRQSASALSTCRSWHRDKLAWVPERSDHPAKAPPTNFGLVEWQRAHSGKQAEGGGHMLSVYMSAFPRHPASAFCPPHSARTPRTLSSHLHPANNVNKDLGLRHSALLQVPDRPARPLPRLSAARPNAHPLPVSLRGLTGSSAPLAGTPSFNSLNSEVRKSQCDGKINECIQQYLILRGLAEVHSRAILCLIK